LDHFSYKLFALEGRIKGNFLLYTPRNHLRNEGVELQSLSTSKLNVMIGLLLCTKPNFLEALAAKEFIENFNILLTVHRVLIFGKCPT
jgi:hypothetical protein